MQDNILTECVTHYPNANKTHCRSCNSQSIHHIDREGMNVASTCLVIRNRGNPLDSDRVKKLCSKASSVLLSERNVDRDAAMTKELAQQKEETRKQVAENDRLKRENDYLRCQLTHVLRIMKVKVVKICLTRFPTEERRK